MPINSHTLYVYLENENCIVAGSIFVKVEKFDDIFIPNAFTPNGDEVNDRFYIYGGNSVVKINKFQVLDNWGGVVYEAFDFSPHYAENGWDGTLDGKNLAPNIYVYCVETEYLDGEIKTFCGDVALMR
ncbi:MAG: gliding motility-associated C-terminal domain-containing protein [Saprospiraceae bacterium]